jgi:hypothetical protein
VNLKPGQSHPAVPHVALVGWPESHYVAAPLRRVAVVYHTAQMLRTVETASATVSQHEAWSVPDDAAWDEMTRLHGALQAALTRLADALRDRRYTDRLAAAGGFSRAINPLCPIVASIIDPDKEMQDYLIAPFSVPRLERATLIAHKPKSLVLADPHHEGETLIRRQAGHFVVEDETDWETLAALHRAVEEAGDALLAAKDRYGTYYARANGYIPEQEEEHPAMKEETKEQKERTESGQQATLQIIPIVQLAPHPDNPRLALREEVVAGILPNAAKNSFLPIRMPSSCRIGSGIGSDVAFIGAHLAPVGSQWRCVFLLFTAS